MALTDTPPPAPAAPSSAPSTGGGAKRIVLVLVLAAIACIAVVGVLSVANTPETYDVVIPAGTSEKLEAGEDVALLPAEVELSVGDKLTVTNNDDRLQTVGPLTVRPGETLTYTFSDAGRFSGACSVHPSRSVTFIVT